ncbi:putative manganese-dependent inorganic pyrophosphatase [Limihaloglobus sulfuriphilus]|uniref:Putative manganese-dependent inorganic pyrophosphatase n=1 Tax=Limihaloglobus sulfuriphilus TaxID=1851148 RepID=A0A1Q2MHL0_9BACT|nr:bile acid:sodium symporter [Limihaloglobus sulfuriphilus]AQQ71787.1 putative manganese-dependent inorganic pyrophosphatase [Limihaloglobus sulfuriphilus]
MWNKIAFAQKYLVYNIPACMILGLIYGYYYDASFLKTFIVPLTFLMVYPMMVNLQIKKVFSGGDVKVQLVTQFINFAIIPFAAFGIGKLFFSDSPLIALGLLLAALLPTSGMTISWTGFARGNINAAIKMTVIGLIAGSLATPLYIKWLMGAVIEIPLLNVFKQIAIIVFLPMVAGYSTQRFIIKRYGEAKYHKDIKKKFPLISTIGVLGIVFVAMAIKSKTIISQPSLLLMSLVPLIILYFVNFSISTLVGKLLFSREDAIALVYGTVMRNLSIALAIAMTVFGKQGSDIALIIAIAYIIQVQSAAWYIKFTPKIFGKTPEETAQDIMAVGVFALHNKATLHDAIKMLDEEHIHSIIVLSDDNKPAGVLTAESLINLLADQVSLDRRLDQVELMPVLNIRYDAPISEIAQKMKRKHEYKVIVTDKKGNITGVLTEMDILHNSV